MFSFVQILIIVTVLTIVSYEQMNVQQVFKCCGESVFMGFVTGMVLGNVTLGLLVGGTMQLMSLGLAGFGGASIPNYRVGTTVGTAFAIATGGGLEVALLIGIPTATLGVQLDVFAKMIGSFFLHLAEKAADEGKYKKMYNIIFWGNLFAGRVTFNNTYPALFFLILGSTFIEQLLGIIPGWLTAGLTTVGNVLPALGMAILLKYLPVKSNMHFLILGFVLTVYLNLTILPIAIIGGIIAFVMYNNLQKENSMTRVGAGGLGDE